MKTAQPSATVFSNRNFRLVFFGALVSELGTLLYSFAVSFYILEITGNNASVQGIFLAVCGVVLLLFTPIGGVLGDRFNKAKIMFVCDYLKGGLILLAVLLMVLFPGSRAHLVILFVIGILGNAVSGVFEPAAGALLPHIVAEEKLQQANAIFSAKNALLSIFGIVLAGVFYAAMSVTMLFIVVGVCYVLSGVSEMFIRYAHEPSAERLSLRLAIGDMRSGLRYLKGQKPILVLMEAILFLNFFFVPISSNFLPFFIKTDVAGAPSYLLDHVLTPELWSSVIGMMIGLGSLAGSILMSAKAQEGKCGPATGRRLGITALVMIALSAAYWILVVRGASLNVFLIVLAVGALLIGFLVSRVNIPISTTLMRVVERDKLSKVTSIISIISQGLVPVASVFAGLILQNFGSMVLLIICTVGFAAAAVFLLVSREAKKV